MLKKPTKSFTMMCHSGIDAECYKKPLVWIGSIEDCGYMKLRKYGTARRWEKCLLWESEYIVMFLLRKATIIQVIFE